MQKIDLKKELKHLYQPSAKEVVLVEVPRMNFLMMDGKGAPDSKPYQQSIEILYSVSYTIKFDLKKKGVGPDFTVMPLEGLWWMDGREDFDLEDRDNWRWTSLILQPGHVTAEHVSDAVERVRAKKDLPSLDRIRFESYDEGLSAQILHIGPYSEEDATVQKIHAFVSEHGYKLYKKHHEIYLGDPRRTQPEKLKTVIRHPVRKE